MLLTYARGAKFRRSPLGPLGPLSVIVLAPRMGGVVHMSGKPLSEVVKGSVIPLHGILTDRFLLVHLSLALDRRKKKQEDLFKSEMFLQVPFREAVGAIQDTNRTVTRLEHLILVQIVF